LYTNKFALHTIQSQAFASVTSQPSLPYGCKNEMGNTMSGYSLDRQIGFILRRVNQRHLAIFSQHMPDLTPTQFAALAKLVELGEMSQNELGRKVAMDAATIKGVADRLTKRGVLNARRNPKDSRQKLLSANSAGIAFYQQYVSKALRISEKTLSPLTAQEQGQLLDLLQKLA